MLLTDVLDPNPAKGKADVGKDRQKTKNIQEKMNARATVLAPFPLRPIPFPLGNTMVVPCGK